MARQPLSPVVIALVLVAILALSVFLYFWLAGGVAETPAPAEPVAVAAPEAVPAEPEVEPEIELPPLDASDRAVRTLVGELSDHPQLAAWLVPERLVRRFVAAVVNVAEDESPRKHLDAVRPPGRFRATQIEDKLFTDPRSHARYDAFAEAFESLDVAAGARLYRQMKPLFDEAYRDLGYPDGEFDDVLARAIDRVLATPMPLEQAVLQRRVTGFRYADRELEELGPAAKHLLRMGPVNARKVHTKLRQMRSALALE